MDDLERDLSTQLHRRSEEVAPGEDLPARIRSQVDRRQRRRRLIQTAVPTLCLLVGAVAFVAVVGHGGGTPRSTSSAPLAGPGRGVPSTSHSTPAPSSGSSNGAGSVAGPVIGQGSFGQTQTTAGWVPVDYGKAQVSVPPGAVTSSNPCPDASAAVTVHLGRQPTGVFNCPFEPVGVTTVGLESLPAGTSTAGLMAHTVNGVKEFSTGLGNPEEITELVPSLGVEVEASGPLASRVVGTLTRSLRAVALAGGRAPRVPRSWHRVTFGGLSVAVPATWPVEQATDEGTSCERRPPWDLGGLHGVGSQPMVILDAGQAPLPPSCPVAGAVQGDQPVEQATDGLVIDPGPVGPLSGVTSYGSCISVARLRICPANDPGQNGELVLGVHLPDGKKVALVLGDAVSGKTAPTILDSLRPA